MKISRRKSAQENPAKMDKEIIDSWLEKHADPAIDRLVKKNLAIAYKIKSILDKKELKPVDLARLMSKQKSEISKWLSGQHTFSMRTIADIENVLDEDIVHIEPKLNNVYFTTYVRYQSVPEVESELEFEDSSFVGDYKTA